MMKAPDRRDTVSSSPGRSQIRFSVLAVAWRLVLSAAILTVLWKLLDLDDLTRQLRSVHFWWLVIGVASALALRLLLAWQRYLLAVRFGLSLRYRTMLRILFVSTFYSAILPGDLAGGIAAWFKLARLEGKGPEAMAVVTFARILDMVSVLVLGFCAATAAPPAEIGVDVRLWGSAMLVLLLGCCLPLISAPMATWVDRLVKFLVLHRLPGFLGSRLQRLTTAIILFHANRRYALLPIFCVSLLVAGGGGICYWILARAIGLFLPFGLLLWLRAALLIVQFIPITFSGLGLREAVTVVLLHPAGVTEAQAVSISLLVFVTILLVALIGGLCEFTESRALATSKARFDE